VTINPKNGRSERIFVNLEAVYPTPERPGTELSFEELRAAHRGWLSKVWERELQEQKQSHDLEPCEPTEELKIGSGTVTRTIPVKLDIPRDPVLVDENGMKKEHHKEGKQRRMKVKEVNETQISMS
jgi:checkpoint serine/threonine-protein kinase